MPRAARTPGNGNGRSKRATSSPQIPLATEVNGSPVVDVETEIRRRAFELYEQRGRTPGHEHEDWVVAEREVLARVTHQGA